MEAVRISRLCFRHKSLLQKSLLSVVVLSSIYIFYSLNSGITITNDGSHFALVDALVTTGSPELGNVKQFAFGDSARYDGKDYSDRNPGLALFTSALYQGLKQIEPWTMPIRLDPKMEFLYEARQKKTIGMVMLVPAVAGSLLMLAIVALCRLLGTGFYAALATSTTLVFGTIALRYATVFYSHIFSATLLVWGMVFVFSFRHSGKVGHLTCGTFLLSTAVLAEHLLVVVFLPLLIYLAATGWRRFQRLATLLPFVAAGMIPMIILMIYNQTCFGSPFSLAHFHHSSDVENYHFATMFRFDQTFNALPHLMFGASKEELHWQDLTGLFSSSPFLWFSLGTLPLVFAGKLRLQAEHYVLLASSTLLTLGAASFWSPYGGWDMDYRYLLVAIPLLAPFLGYSIDYLGHKLISSRKIVVAGAALGLVVFAGLVTLSVMAQFGHVRHDLQLQFPNPFFNWKAALQNVSVFLGVTLLMVAATVAVKRLILGLRSRQTLNFFRR